MVERGHVFVVRGDATAIACDWRIVTSGTRAGIPGDVGTHWLHDERVAARIGAPGWVDDAPNAERRAVVIAHPALAPDGAPGVVAVHTGAEGTEPPEWFAAALEAAATVAAPDTSRHLPQRALPLLVTPMLGTGAGGAGGRRTGVLEALLAAAERVAARGWDVALVVRDAQTFSAAQRVRSELGRWDLSEREQHLAEELAVVARSGKLVPFVGAGASAAAGLAGWRTLLADFAAAVGITSDADRAQLAEMDPRDAAHLLDLRFRTRDESPTTLDAALRAVFADARRSSLVHCLLGSLPIREAATTNYDRLFETAWHNASDQPVTTLPRNVGKVAPQWLLKLHGDVDDDQRALVLSRDEYLRFEHHGGAIAGVMHALLLTRHLLIVGYGLTDETFHRIAHDVREVRESPVQKAVAETATDQRLGTALLVTPADMAKEIWSEDLELVDLTRSRPSLADAARGQEVLLDRLAHLAAPAEAYVLGAGWEELTPRGPDSELRETLDRLGSIRGLGPPLQRSVDDVLERFGRPRGTRG